MDDKLWKQILRDRDICCMRAERNLINFKGMSMLYDAELSVDGFLKSSLRDGNLDRIAVYGAGRLGFAFASFVRRRGCRVDYFVDRNGAAPCDDGIQCYMPGDSLPDTQLLVVSTEYDYDDIAAEMKKTVKCPVIAMSCFLQEQLDSIHSKEEV